MYIRKKNRSGTISMVIVSKSGNRYKEVKTFGVASSSEDVESLFVKGTHWLRNHGGQYEDFTMIPMIDNFKNLFKSKELNTKTQSYREINKYKQRKNSVYPCLCVQNNKI